MEHTAPIKIDLHGFVLPVLQAFLIGMVPLELTGLWWFLAAEGPGNI